MQAGCQGFEPPYLHHRISEAAQRPLLLCIEVRGPEPRESEGVKQTRQWRVCSPNTRRTAEPAGGADSCSEYAQSPLTSTIKISRGRTAASFVLYPVPVLMDARELEAVYRKVMA